VLVNAWLQQPYYQLMTTYPAACEGGQSSVATWREAPQTESDRSQRWCTPSPCDNSCRLLHSRHARYCTQQILPLNEIL